MDGARDPDQMSLMSIPSASSSSSLAISSHAVLQYYMVVLLARQASMKVLTKDTLEVYKDDMPSPSYLEQELYLWWCKWINYSGELPNTPSKALVYATESMFPNFHHVLRVICTVPVTSCECERSISVLRLKTYLRSSMGQKRFSGLALMHIHYSMELNLEEIVNIFARQNPRRMVLDLK